MSTLLAMSFFQVALIAAVVFQAAGWQTPTRKDREDSLDLDIDSVEENSTEDPNCKCVDWAEAYKIVSCGMAEEWAPLGWGLTGVQKYSHSLEKGQRLCDEFFYKIPAGQNFCMNMDFRSALGQWCFVSPECKNLDGGKIVEGKFNYKSTLRSVQDAKHRHWVFGKEGQYPLAWKRCAPQRDDMLKFWSLDKTMKFLDDHIPTHDVGAIMRYAYPTMRQRWAYVQGFYNGIEKIVMPDGSESVVLMKAELKSKLASIVESGRVAVWNHFEDEAGSMLTVGKKAFHVPPMLRGGHALHCIHNCNLTNPVPKSPRIV